MAVIPQKKPCWRCEGRGTLDWCASAVRGAPMGSCFTEVCDICGGTSNEPYDENAPNIGYNLVLTVGGKRHADASLQKALHAIRSRSLMR